MKSTYTINTIKNTRNTSRQQLSNNRIKARPGICYNYDSGCISYNGSLS